VTQAYNFCWPGVRFGHGAVYHCVTTAVGTSSRERCKLQFIHRLKLSSSQNFPGLLLYDPRSSIALLTTHKPQHMSELLDRMCPGAHLSFDRRRALAPRWVSKHSTLYALPKAFLSRPDVTYPLPYASRPYPARTLRPERPSADISMQFVSFGARVVLRPTGRTKIKRRIKEGCPAHRYARGSRAVTPWL